MNLRLKKILPATWTILFYLILPFSPHICGTNIDHLAQIEKLKKYKTVYICGFPYSGKTPFIQLLNRSSNVYVIPGETWYVTPKEVDAIESQNRTAEVIASKGAHCWTTRRPELDPSSEVNHFSGYHKIFFIRNPLYVFPTIMRRFQQSFHLLRPEPRGDHNMANWRLNAKFFLRQLCSKGKRNDILLIRYEDIWEKGRPVDYLNGVLSKIGARNITLEEMNYDLPYDEHKYGEDKSLYTPRRKNLTGYVCRNGVDSIPDKYSLPEKVVSMIKNDPFFKALGYTSNTSNPCGVGPINCNAAGYDDITGGVRTNERVGHPW